MTGELPHTMAEALEALLPTPGGRDTGWLRCLGDFQEVELPGFCGHFSAFEPLTLLASFLLDHNRGAGGEATAAPLTGPLGRPCAEVTFLTATRFAPI